MWIVGVHGGAGDSTISELSPHSREAHHRWPQPPPYGSVLCLMVARTNAADLHNARAAAREWAAGAQPHVVLLGLPPGALPTTRIKRMTCGQAQDILAKPIEWPADVVRAATELSAVDSLMCLPSLRKPTRGAGTPSAKRNRRAHAPMKT